MCMKTVDRLHLHTSWHLQGIVTTKLYLCLWRSTARQAQGFSHSSDLSSMSSTSFSSSKALRILPPAQLKTWPLRLLVFHISKKRKCQTRKEIRKFWEGVNEPGPRRQFPFVMLTKAGLLLKYFWEWVNAKLYSNCESNVLTWAGKTVPQLWALASLPEDTGSTPKLSLTTVLGDLTSSSAHSGRYTDTHVGEIPIHIKSYTDLRKESNIPAFPGQRVPDGPRIRRMLPSLWGHLHLSS